MDGGKELEQRARIVDVDKEHLQETEDFLSIDLYKTETIFEGEKKKSVTALRTPT
jgi:hypothetical protein